MPDDLAKFRAFNPGRGKPCKVQAVASQLKPAARKELMTAVAESDITSGAIEKWALEEHGLTLGARSVSRHRSGECPCPKG